VRTTTPVPDKEARQIERTAIVRTCPNCGHKSLVAKGQLLFCHNCEKEFWRSES
jgi:transcription elongation factor Elf1